MRLLFREGSSTQWLVTLHLVATRTERQMGAHLLPALFAHDVLAATGSALAINHCVELLKQLLRQCPPFDLPSLFVECSNCDSYVEGGAIGPLWPGQWARAPLRRGGMHDVMNHPLNPLFGEPGGARSWQRHIARLTRER